MADLMAVSVETQKALDVLVDLNAIKLHAVNWLLKQASKQADDSYSGLTSNTVFTSKEGLALMFQLYWVKSWANSVQMEIGKTETSKSC